MEDEGEHVCPGERGRIKEGKEGGGTAGVLVRLSALFLTLVVFLRPPSLTKLRLQCVDTHTALSASLRQSSVFSDSLFRLQDWKHNTRHTPHCESQYTPS